jgi:cytochrome b pre-mRNA-processing protein 3
MSIEYINFYNNLIKLTTNKSLYSDIINLQDTFSDRLTLFLFHFAFILKEFKKADNEKKLQELYDFNFRQLELSIREIGYGDQSINKKMKDYLNLFHTIISEVHFWDKIDLSKKKVSLSKFLQNFNNIEFLIDYFDDFSSNLKKYDLNSYLKSVNKHNYGSPKT